MGRNELLLTIKSITESDEPIVGIIGAGTLGQAYTEFLLARGAANLIFYNRSFDKAHAVYKDKIQGLTGASMDFNDDNDVPSSLVADAKSIRSGETAVYTYTRGEKENHKIVITSDPSIFALTSQSLDSVYYTLGRSEHGPEGVQIDRDLSIEDNFAILADMVPKLGLAYAEKAVHMVTSNPDNLIVRGYQEITDLPANQVFALGTAVDAARLAHVISTDHDLVVQNIKSPIVLGNHGPDMIITPQLTTIVTESGRMSLDEFIVGYLAKFDPDVQINPDDYLEEIRQKAAKAGGEILYGKSEGTSQGPAEVAYRLSLDSVGRKVSGLKPATKMILTAATPLGMYGVDRENVWLGHLVEINQYGEINPIKLELTGEQMVYMQETAKRLDDIYQGKSVQGHVLTAKVAVENTTLRELAQKIDRDNDGFSGEIVAR